MNVHIVKLKPLHTEFRAVLSRWPKECYL